MGPIIMSELIVYGDHVWGNTFNNSLIAYSQIDGVSSLKIYLIAIYVSFSYIKMEIK